MRDVKMAELAAEAPLAKTEDWCDFSDFQTSEDVENSNKDDTPSSKSSPTTSESMTNDNSFVDNFSETFSNSLEDLVNTFDDKITKCFCDYDENVEKLAPVQIRTQEEILSECQTWWTITGNFGNILPIDWSKSYARKLQLPALNLNERAKSERLDDPEGSDEEDLAKDLDLHALILSSLQQEPIFTAEQVLEEIDEIMQENVPAEEVHSADASPEKANNDAITKNAISSLVYGEKLKTLSAPELTEVLVELERLIREHSETLIQELALRDELEFEKELKNSFISLLLSVQNKRRHFHIDRRKGARPTSVANHNGPEPKYLTTVIPYNVDKGPPSNASLQILIKILHAINDDSPTVPTLLTDYILKVLCPT